jgi:hypothetical protein
MNGNIGRRGTGKLQYCNVGNNTFFRVKTPYFTELQVYAVLCSSDE